MSAPVRKAAVAGSWYPGDRDALAAEVGGYLAAIGPHALAGRLVALIAPHAGFRYSGPVAAHAYAQLGGRSTLTAILVGPSHRVAFDGVSVCARGAFETPLGRVPIAEPVAEALIAAHPKITADPWPHRQEHSLEMQLPFLQHLVRDVRIVPALLGTQARSEVELLAAALSGVASSGDTVLIASSDLSHYHPADEANALDARVAEHVRRFDPEGLMDRLESYRGHACGGGAIVAVMKAARTVGARRAEVLRYADSGDVAEGDKTRVVGYLAAALTTAEAAA
jgi:AmmeMemoRadiSam system protein B